MALPHPVTNGRVAAYIDMGTYSVRLLIARVQPAGAYTILNRRKEAVRLGEGELENEIK